MFGEGLVVQRRVSPPASGVDSFVIPHGGFGVDPMEDLFTGRQLNVGRLEEAES